MMFHINDVMTCKLFRDYIVRAIHTSWISHMDYPRKEPVTQGVDGVVVSLIKHVNKQSSGQWAAYVMKIRLDWCDFSV